MSSPFGRRSLDIAGLSVTLAMPTHRDLHPLTVNSLLQTQTECFERGIPLDVVVTVGSSLVHHARSKLAWEFLRGPRNRLFWVDSDMQWEPEAFTRLLALSTKMDMVAAAYTAKQDPPLMMVRGDLSSMQTNEHGCVALDGLGMGFCVISRHVVETLSETAPKAKFNEPKEPIPHLFEFGLTEDGAAEGEDMFFFRRAKEHGFQLWVDPTVRLGHIGPKSFSSRMLDFLEAKAAAPSMDNATVSSAA